MRSIVDYSKKGQFKIQQMAFVLVAMMIFFAIVALFYFTLSSNSLQQDVENLRGDEVLEVAKKVSATPEFAWNIEGCVSCIDLDKVLVLKDRISYEGFWRRISFLQIKKVYPAEDERECTKSNYPECESVTLVDNGGGLVSYSTFASLCRYDSERDQNKCEIGKVIVGFETIQ